MKIRSLASPGFVFEASEEAAKELIEAGIYEAADEGEVRTADAEPLETRPARRIRRTRG